MADRFRIVPAAYVLLRRGDEVLLQRRQNTGYRDGFWAAAGAGHVEFGETVFAAACREAGEELGVRIDEADLMPLTTMHRTAAPHQSIDERVDFFFACYRWHGTPRIRETAKAADLRWWPVTGLPDPVVPHEQFVIDAWAAGTLPTIVTFGFDL